MEKNNIFEYAELKLDSSGLNFNLTTGEVQRTRNGKVIETFTREQWADKERKEEERIKALKLKLGPEICNRTREQAYEIARKTKWKLSDEGDVICTIEPIQYFECVDVEHVYELLDTYTLGSMVETIIRDHNYYIDNNK